MGYVFFFPLRHALAYLPPIIAAKIQGMTYKTEICKVIVCRTQSNYRQQITRGEYNRNKFADVKFNNEYMNRFSTKSVCSANLMLIALMFAFSLNSCDGNTKGELNGHEYVDLGLPSGLLWASCNVGAVNPEDYGSYFAWGETSPKNTYIKDNYTYSSLPSVLPPNDDAATTNWGNDWHTPTADDFTELIDECTWTWMSNGYKVVGPNGNNIFLPAAGWHHKSLSSIGTQGQYWTSSSHSPSGPIRFWLDSDEYFLKVNEGRLGYTVRPVASPQK